MAATTVDPSPVKQLRALTFDLDDTLWDNRPVLMAAEQVLYDWLGEHYPRIGARFSLEELRKLRLVSLQRDPELRHDVTRLRKASLQIAAETAGYDHSLVDPALEIFLAARHRVAPYSDVVPALQRLRVAGYCLGTLTNGNIDIERLGLDHLFDFSLSAATCGKAKPHPRMFREACRRAGVEPAELAHIGDEPETDLAGARNAGVVVIWMNRGKRLNEPEVMHHAEIRNMTELLSLLRLTRQ